MFSNKELVEAMNQNSGVSGRFMPITYSGGINPNGMYTNGVTGNNQPQQSFLKKHKTHLLIAGAVVLGYLAYKKFKK